MPVVYSRKRLRALERSEAARLNNSHNATDNNTTSSKPSNCPPVQTTSPSSIPSNISSTPAPPSSFFSSRRHVPPPSSSSLSSQLQRSTTNLGQPNTEQYTTTPASVNPQVVKRRRHQPQKQRRTRALIQTYLDVGQADISCRQCSECGMLYAPGARDDNAVHARHHAKWIRDRDKRPRFPGWMGERVVGSVRTGRLVAVKACDVATWTKRAMEIDEFVSRQHLHMQPHERLRLQRTNNSDSNNLSSYSSLSLPSSSPSSSSSSWLVILFVVDAAVHAFLLTELVSGGCLASVAADGVATVNSRCRVDGRTLCGVRKIWVAHDWRRKGIASAMLDAARLNLLYGVVLRLDDVAFTATTTAGAKFAAACATKCNNKHVIIYSQSDVVQRNPSRTSVPDNDQVDSKE